MNVSGYLAIKSVWRVIFIRFSVFVATKNEFKSFTFHSLLSLTCVSHTVSFLCYIN